MNLLDKIVINNQSILNELFGSLTSINETDRSLYSKPELVAGNASIGGHVRHILDFYFALFSGLPGNEIDYDKRERDPVIESELTVAGEKIRVICEQLEQLKGSQEQKISVSVTTDATIAIMEGKSTLLRELQFVHSHTTHHMAIISIILRVNHITPATNFGKAPSTVAYEQKQACAQ